MSTITSKPVIRICGLTILLAAGGIGYAVGAFGQGIGLLIPFALAGVLVLYRPVIGLVLAAFIIPIENIFLFPGANSATKLLAVFVAGAWFLSKLINRESWRRILESRVVWALALFVAYCFSSIFWAELPQSGIPAGLLRMVMLSGLGFLSLDLVRTWDEAQWLTRALVLGATIGAMFTLFQFVGGNVNRAGEGIAGGINATAALLLMVIPFAFAMIRGESARGWRLIGVIFVGLGVTAVTLTFSRMSFLILPVLLAVELWETFRIQRGRIEVLALLAVGVVIFFSFVPFKDVTDRIATIGPYIEQTLDSSEGALVDRSGRGFHIAVAFAIFRENPIAGAGFGNYGHLFLRRYQHEVAGGGRLYQSPRSSHGNYWGFLADLGIIGVALWISVLAFAFSNLKRAWSRYSGERASYEFTFVRAVTLTFLIQAVYGMHGEMHYEKMFWLILGVSGAVAYLRSSGSRTARALSEGGISAQRRRRNQSPVVSTNER